MTWPFGERSVRGVADDLLSRERGKRSGGRGAVGTVSRDQSLRLSVAWACLRLRADMVSTMPLDAYRKAGGVRLEAPKPPVLTNPDGDRVEWEEWAYSSQMDLDTYGNTMGVIEAVDASPQQRPARIRLVSAGTAAVRERDGRLQYRFGSDDWLDESKVWHEKQHTVPGLPVGLSPIAYAALSLQSSLSAAEFANTWFGNSATPAAHLKNTGKKLDKAEAARTKMNFKAQVADGDVFVTGNDWDFKLITGKASEAMFLEQQSATNSDVCRYLGVPGDMVDVATASGSITYANITQRNLQFLITSLGPVLTRRENVFSRRLMPQPRYVKFNRGALLQMDLAGRYAAHKVAIDGRFLTPDEARAFEDLPPLTPEQEEQFSRLFGNKAATPTIPTAPGGAA